MPTLDNFLALRALDKSEAPIDALHRERLSEAILDEWRLTIKAAALRFAQHYKCLDEVGDLEAEARLALMRAVYSFDPERPDLEAFERVAFSAIRNALIDYIRSSLCSVRRGLATAQATIISQEEDVSEGLSRVVDADPSAVAAFRRAEYRDLVQNAIEAVERGITTPRKRAAWMRAKQAIKLRFFDALPLRDVASEMKLSSPATCNLIARGMEMLKPHLAEALA